MPDLRPLFQGLPSPPPSVAEAPILAAIPVPESPSFRVARSARNYPLVLLETVGAPPAMPPLELEHIRIEHARTCRVEEPGGAVHSGVFTIFSCTTGDTVLQDHFLLVAGALIGATPSDPQAAAIAEAIETMAELFRALQAPARASAQGLWAEVFMIAESRKPAELARAWRVAADDRFDFSSRATRIEVKSASGHDRTHHFSLEQLRPPVGVRALVASIRVEHAGGGTALEDLLVELRPALAGGPDLLLRVESIVATTLGSTFRAAITERFDREAARASLSYYRVEDVPSIREALPPGVSDVHFRANLGSATGVDPRQLLADGDDPLIGGLPSPRYRP